MSKTLLLVGRPVARAADVLAHNRDRRRRINQFHSVARVTLTAEPGTASDRARQSLEHVDRNS